VPEVTGHILIIYLCIGKGSKATGTPVDDSIATVDKSLIIEVYKNLTNCV
jgi:hypothetical protein